MGKSWAILAVAVVVVGCGIQKTENPQPLPDSAQVSERTEQRGAELQSKSSSVASAQMKKKQVLLIAEAKAKSEGYDIDKYKMTGCHYEFTDKDQTWTVFYELKPPTPPGGHFLVSINDQTKEARLAHGE